MKATELRIGNYVQYQDKPVKVTGLNACMIDADEIFDPLIEDNFNPIPLTEEWLKKFGFEFNQYWNAYHMGRFKLNKGWYLCDVVYDVAIKYVHQLQNLYFALTGEELTLKK